MAYPSAAALKQAGNRVLSIVGARTKELVILEGKCAPFSDALLITTDDGSYAEKGFVTDKLAAGRRAAKSIHQYLTSGEW